MTERLIWFGQLASKRALTLRGMFMVAGGVLWLLIFLALPTLVLMAVAFTERGPYGQIHWSFTTENLWRLLGWGTFGWSPETLRILGRSIMVAAITTTACVALSYPLAFFIAARPQRTRYLWLTLVIIPFCTNLVVRTYAWMLLLSAQFPLARLAQWLGLLEPGQALYPSQGAVYLGMITTLLPFTVLPIYTNVERLDWSIVEAATDLYASRFRVFWHAILPQTLPGLTVAIVLTFIPAMAMFVVPNLLGGAKYMLVGDLIQQQFNQSRDYPFGAALSLGLIVLTLIGLYLWRRSGSKAGEVL